MDDGEFKVDAGSLDLVITSKNRQLGPGHRHSQFSSLELGCNVSI